MIKVNVEFEGLSIIRSPLRPCSLLVVTLDPGLYRTYVIWVRPPVMYEVVIADSL